MNAAGGNPFRLLLSPTRIPPAADVTGSPYGDPSFADSPWPDGALGGTFVDAYAFTVVSQACGGAEATPQLLLTMALEDGLACGTIYASLNVSLTSRPGELSARLKMNSTRPCEVLVAHGWLTGLGLDASPTRNQTQRGIAQFESGQVGGPAWENSGGYYGQQVPASLILSLSLSRTHTHSLSLSHPLSTHHLSLAHARVHTHTHPLSLYRARALSHTHSRTVTFSLAGALLLCTLLLCTLLLCTLLLCTLLLCTLLLYLYAVTLSLAAARDFVSLALFLAPWRCGRKCFGRGLG